MVEIKFVMQLQILWFFHFNIRRVLCTKNMNWADVFYEQNQE